ncbi:MAG: PIN domain-containing protein [Planctomycetes bacterium]|nr:PIN domain-containing protein [Planctomycetota bacterium]
MKIYLDVSCLNRPFDDQDQARIRIETAAVTLIFERIDAGLWQQVSSEMAVIEIDAITDADRQNRVRVLLPQLETIMKLNQATFQRSAELERLGFKPADAVHVAAAERAEADVLLSCDDRLCRLAKRRRRDLRVMVANPLDWLKEMEDADA